MLISHKRGMQYDVSVRQFTAKLDDRRDSAAIAHANRKAKRIAKLILERYGQQAKDTSLVTGAVLTSLAKMHLVDSRLLPYVVAKTQMLLAA